MRTVCNRAYIVESKVACVLAGAAQIQAISPGNKAELGPRFCSLEKITPRIIMILSFQSGDETAMLVYKTMAKCRSSFA